MHEVAYHKILEMIFKLLRKMFTQPSATYRNLGKLLENLVLHLDKFNAVAVDSYFTERLLSFMDTAPECILDTIIIFFVDSVF